MPSPSETKTGPESALGDGGPAFPNGYTGRAGMTLRDWFAGQELAAMGGWSPCLPNGRPAEGADRHRVCAEWAYAQADAMLAARAKAAR